MKKYIAVQSAPEIQESPWTYNREFWITGGLIVDGNSHFYSYTTPEYDRIKERGFNEKDTLRALYFLTKIKYKMCIIRGCCQSDWQRIFYPESLEPDILTIETEYFNLGTEYFVDDYCIYCYTDDHKKEIANYLGTTPDNVILRRITGAKKVYTYEEE